MITVRADDVSPQAWRNGGGRTRELLREPGGDDWTLRISLADIDGDGPFSAFPGVERWFAVVEGAGVELRFDGEVQRMTAATAPLRFDGANAPACRLLAGPTRDLNLMHRGGRALMSAVDDHAGWTEHTTHRGLFARLAGTLHDSDVAIDVPAFTLVWGLRGTVCRFVRADAVIGASAPAGWWLAHEPGHR